MIPIEKITITNNNGYLDAAIHKPSSKIKGVAILLPGYLDSKDYNHLVELGNNLAEYGYIAIRFDATGTWDSSGTIENYSVSQRLNDLEKVIFFSNNEFQPKKILLVGHSMGGMIALLYAAGHSLIDTVIAVMTPYAFVRPGSTKEKDKESQWARNGYKTSHRDIPDNREKKQIFKVPYSIVVDSRPYDVLKIVNKIAAPILLIAGELDNVVPPNDIQLLYEKANKPKKILILPKIGHDYRYNRKEILKVNESISQYLIKNGL